MPRFDVHALRDGAGLVVNVQSDHTSNKVTTRIVAPLLALNQLKPLISELNPVVEVNGETYVFVAHALATLTQREMSPLVGTVAMQQDALVRALDIALTGF